METKQPATKKPMDQQWNQRGNFKNTLRKTTMKTQPYKIYGMQQKKKKKYIYIYIYMYN